MMDDARTVAIDMDTDQTRWGLAGVETYQCPRCGFRCRAMFDGCAVEQEPLLTCCSCYQQHKRLVKLRLVLSPEQQQ